MKWREMHYAMMVMATAGVIILLSFYSVVKHPAGFLFGKSPDALKNYYNFAYYLKYGKGLHFEGQNYPYGEHLLFTDSHPGLALVVNWIDDNLVTVHDHAVGILNLTMLGSIILGVLILFLLARKLSLPRYYAMLIALIIAFLSPQLHRMQGHFSLSQSFWIPLFLYGWWRFSIEKNTTWSVFLCVSGLVGGFIHPYYTGIYTAFGLSFWFSRLLISKQGKLGSAGLRWHELTVAILPLLIIKALLLVSDPFSQRPDSLFGFFSYYATPTSILLPDFSPIRFLIEHFFTLSFPWEGRSFVGSPAALFVLFMTLMILAATVSGGWKFLGKVFPNKNWNPFLSASFIVLLFSMCFPFRFGFEFVIDWFPQLKQFRALGRFSWVFYYVITLYTGYYIYLVYRWLKLKSIGWIFPRVFLIFLMSLWAVDSLVNLQNLQPHIFNSNDKLEPHHTEFVNRLVSGGYQPTDFQAIISLPFTSTTGDKLLFELGEQTMSEALKASWHTGLPLIQNLAPRSTLEHGLKNVQLLSHPLIPKSKLDDISQKPLLLVSSKVFLSEPEQRLKMKSLVFWEDEFIQLANLPIEVFAADREGAMTQLDTFRKYHACNSRLCMDLDSGFLLFEEFESTGDWRGAEMTVWEGFLPESAIYNISFWLFIDDAVAAMPDLTISGWDKTIDRQVRSDHIQTRSSFDVFEKWLRINFDVSSEPEIFYELKLSGERIKFNRLLIKPSEANVLSFDSLDRLYFNNYPVEMH